MSILIPQRQCGFTSRPPQWSEYHNKGSHMNLFVSQCIQKFSLHYTIDAETEAPILWPPDAKSQLTGKDPDAGKNWRLVEKGTTEDEMVGWCHRLNGHEFQQALGVGEGQGSLVCCSPWGLKESDMTEWLNRNETFQSISAESSKIHIDTLTHAHIHTWPVFPVN